ncbi:MULTISPECIES: mandelate racemase/muconate lactonizing enzyme family protein [unclassified Streptomyces]|uniref:mandelate racemase/muconate lactonizing enzyme family protein n=1 Tax=unclassified Streptomyces TaxID=2593676 RepID=UPI002877A1A9|nr:mandelate racemase/muconate lactonizing enzyme family protein [Streptomyces sp. BB1-1-1]WND39710.1 mandelate racemase/muconate lactonizing enzyme family protein [Streptomyces sp. BB1-1-1]
MRDEASAPEETTRSEGKSRRSLLKLSAAGLGGLSLGALAMRPVEEQVDYLSQNVSRASKPSQLKITDLRVAVLDGVPFTSPIVRISTNQGISGYGEVRDDADKRYALELKSRLLGENPCNVEMLFKRIKQFGNHGRRGGGVSGVEMALWDLAGKAYGVPVFALLGGAYRKKIRLYTDTTESENPKEYAARMKDRVDKGFTFLKMDLGLELVAKKPGTVVGGSYWDDNLEQYNGDPGSYGQTQHNFTMVQLTDKGLEMMAEYVEAVRDAIGYDIPMGMDHTGHFDVNTAIRLANRFERYNLAWLEDLVPWFHTEDWKEITKAVNVPTMTGEDIYGLEAFRKLCDEDAVDLIQPDPATAGGILETKRIGDYAAEKGKAMPLHYAGSPVGAMASAHIAAATETFVALEYHATDVPFWNDLVQQEEPLMNKGWYQLTDKPGLGIEMDEKEMAKHLLKGEKLFAPTPEWNKKVAWDRTWS